MVFVSELSSKMDCERIKLWRYRCKRCSFKSNFVISFRDHVRRAHTEKKISLFTTLTANCYICEYCSFSSYSLIVLLNHNLDCEDYTQKKFSDPNIIIDATGNGLKYECYTCNYLTNRADYLELHIVRHHTAPEEIEWFYCQQCLFRTYRKSCLKGHMTRNHKNSCTNMK